MPLHKHPVCPSTFQFLLKKSQVSDMTLNIFSKYAESQATNSAPLIHAANVCTHNSEYCWLAKIWLKLNPLLIIWPCGSSRSGPENTDESFAFSSYQADSFPYYRLLIIYQWSVGVLAGKWSKFFWPVAWNWAANALLGPWSTVFRPSVVFRTETGELSVVSFDSFA